MNNQSVHHEPGMCDRFSSFFHEKIVKAKTRISTMKAQLTSIPPRAQTDTSQNGPCLDFLAETTVVEVSKLIAHLPNKSSPLDYIHTSVLKNCSDVFSPLIVHLANLSFAERQFPDQFKVTQVTPLIKKHRASLSCKGFTACCNNWTIQSIAVCVQKTSQHRDCSFEDIGRPLQDHR